MANPLLELSEKLAATVESAGRFIVASSSHPRVPASGIHWRPGIIVTTEHTLKNQPSAELTLPDGSKHAAKVAGKDAATGIAILSLETHALPVAESADSSQLRAGNLTLVVGRSARSGGVTASMGIISAVSGAWRTWHGGQVDQHVQLDMGLYPGSNGGAVVDTDGKVIGLATSAFSRLGAVAIPSSTVNRIVDNLLKNGYVPRGYLGVGLRPVPLPAAMQQTASSGDTALIVLSIEPGSASDKAGLLVGDLLIALDGKQTRDPEDVQGALGGDAIGKALAARVLRGGKLIELSVTVGERGAE